MAQTTNFSDRPTEKNSDSSKYPSYFMKIENLFERRSYNQSDSNEPRSFHLTQPEDRFKAFVFDNQQSTLYASLAPSVTQTSGQKVDRSGRPVTSLANNK